MPIERFETDKAPAPVGPYSQVVKAGGFVYTAGQIPVDMATGEIVNQPIARATEITLDNLKAVLEAAGASLDQCVAISVYLSDMDDFAAMNEVYARYFGDSKPVRAAIEAASLPKGVSIEIQATAYVGE